MEDLFEQMMSDHLCQTRQRSIRRRRQGNDELKTNALREAMGESFNTTSDSYDASSFLDMDHELGTEPLGGELELLGPSTFVDLRYEEDL